MLLAKNLVSLIIIIDSLLHVINETPGVGKGLNIDPKCVPPISLLCTPGTSCSLSVKLGFNLTSPVAWHYNICKSTVTWLYTTINTTFTNNHSKNYEKYNKNFHTIERIVRRKTMLEKYVTFSVSTLPAQPLNYNTNWSKQMRL